MDAYSKIKLIPQFIQGTKGALFTIGFLPEDKSSEVILFLPAFTEEMNRCRVMVAMQARRLVAQGKGVLLLDYYGTGDSAGEFVDASWEQWQQDVQSAINWIHNQGYQHISLWGMRLGALLAKEIANFSSSTFHRLLLWQPVTDGEKYLTQFLRIRLSFLMERGGVQESTQQIKTALSQGNTVEIAGYPLSAKLANELENKKWQQFKNLDGLEIHWMEWVFDDASELPLVSQKIINEWKHQGFNVVSHSFVGPSFWQAHEREITPSLIELTSALFL